MANSKYEYVKLFERDDILLPNTFPVIRIDGHSFHRFSKVHDFNKPNDERALRLMSCAAKAVMKRFEGSCECVCAYGISDEYSFVFSRDCAAFQRRESKLQSTVVSVFTGAYILNWSTFFPTTPLHYAPSFDGRVVLYPSVRNVRDYLSWRQVDQHVNNLYNTAFWALQLMQPLDPPKRPRQSGRTTDAESTNEQKEVKRKLTAEEAELRLRGTVSAEKHDILFLEYDVNYNKEPEMYKKGTVLLYPMTENKRDGPVEERYVDIISDQFWNENQYILKQD